MALLAACCAVASPKARGQEEILSSRAGANPAIAVDGLGRATAIWISNDTPEDSPILSTAFRVRAGSRTAKGTWAQLPGWLSEKGVVVTFPGHTSGEGDNQWLGPAPRIALAAAPGGKLFAAWVRVVDDVRRIEFTSSDGFGQPFRPPIALESACGNPKDITRLHIVADDAGGHLLYMDQCVASSSSRWRAVVFSASGELGVKFPLAPETTGGRGNLMRSQGQTYFVGNGRAPGSPLYLYQLGTTQVLNTRIIVPDAGVLGAQRDAAALPDGKVVTAARIFQDGEYKVLLDVGDITTAAGFDSMILDAVPGNSASTPRVAAGPDGSMVAVWFEDGGIYTSVRRGGVWSVPQRAPFVGNSPPYTVINDSLRVSVAAAGVAQIVWNANVLQNDGSSNHEWGYTSLDLLAGPPYLPKAATHVFTNFYWWPALAVLPDGRGLAAVTHSVKLNEVMGASVLTLPSPRPVTTPAVNNTKLPVITGKPKVGAKLKADPGKWKPSGATLTYRWFANGKAISGATKRTLKLKPAQLGKKITVRVTAKAAGHKSATATSKATGKVKR